MNPNEKAHVLSFGLSPEQITRGLTRQVFSGGEITYHFSGCRNLAVNLILILTYLFFTGMGYFVASNVDMMPILYFFYAFDLLFLCVVIYSIFLRTSLWISRSKVEIRQGIGFIGWRRTVDKKDILSASICLGTYVFGVEYFDLMIEYNQILTKKSLKMVVLLPDKAALEKIVSEII